MTVSPYRRVIQGLLFLIYCSFGISWLAFSPLLADVEKAFSITHAQAGLIVSIVSLAKAFVPLLAGLVAARFGLKRTLTGAAVLAGLAVLMPLAPNFQTLVALRFLFGVGGACVVTLSGAALMGWFPREELPMVNGLNNVAVNTGICIALYTAVPLSERLGWHGTLTVFGALSLVLAVAWTVFGKDAPVARQEAVPQGLFKDVLKRRETWLLALGFTGPLALYLALNTWLPAHYMAAFHLSKADAARATGLFNLVGIPAAVLGGYLSGRLGLRRPLIMLSGLLTPLAGLGMVLSPDASIRTACAAVLGVAFFLYVSPLFTIPMELPGMTARHVAVLNGVVYSVAYTLSFLSPLVVGKLKDVGGSFVPGFVIFALFSAVLLVSGFLLPETGPAKGRVRQFAVRLSVMAA